MQLHLVGGFLGSGKSTAIGSACELLRDRGVRAAVVTNDQGEMLVDTGALAGTAAAVAEVTGGCFCCRYPELVERVAALAADGAEHVFAEAVGSCVDIARTVVNPLLSRREVALQAVTFTVLADARLLAGYLAGRPLPWTNPALDYLFERQLAEAPLLIASRADLVAAAWGGPEGLRDVLQAGLPGRRLLVQDSRSAAGVAAWMRHIDASGAAGPSGAAAPGVPPSGDALLSGVEVDYERYGAAEAALAWNDREVELTGVEGHTTGAARAVIEGVVAALRDRGGAVGHLKFLVRDHYRDAKVSVTGADLAGGGAVSGGAWRSQLPDLVGDRVTLIVNARVEMDADALDRLIDRAVAEAAVALSREHSSTPVHAHTRSHAAFRPAYPEPVHRITPHGAAPPPHA
ncbi:MAG: hypothetical protein OXP69_24410 [Spirochaetaceae bacterium]|nr:hypothetical protein [Spirochaetaceae bacterium]